MTTLRQTQNQLRDNFKQNIFEELGINDNPKREALFDLAWEYGHSAGYTEVRSYAMELLELIK